MKITEDMYFAEWQQDEITEAVDYAAALVLALDKCLMSSHHEDGHNWELSDTLATLIYVTEDIDEMQSAGRYCDLVALMRRPETERAIQTGRGLITDCGDCMWDHMDEYHSPTLYATPSERQDWGLREW